LKVKPRKNGEQYSISVTAMSQSPVCTVVCPSTSQLLLYATDQLTHSVQFECELRLVSLLSFNQQEVIISQFHSLLTSVLQQCVVIYYFTHPRLTHKHTHTHKRGERQRQRERGEHNTFSFWCFMY
jgi:hypothetical protein